MSDLDAFKVGTRVRVPWGVDSVEGAVQAVYGTGPDARVAVLISVPDLDSEPETLTLPARLLEPVGRDEDPDPLGNWLNGYRYWEEVNSRLHQMLSETGAQISAQLHLARGIADAVIQLPDNLTILVECKTSNVPMPKLLAGSAEQLNAYAAGVDGPVAGLVVTPREIPASVAEQFTERHNRDVLPIEAVSWTDEADDPALRAALGRLMTRAA